MTFPRKKLPKHAAAAIKQFRALIRDLDEVAIQKVMAAATNTAKKLER